jgi:uncharacterized SAM-binding protein YcdF (DUF218 family)
MQSSAALNEDSSAPWNKGKLIGQRPSLKLAEIWTVRTQLRMAGNTRELAMLLSKILTQLAMPLSIGGSLIGFGIVALLFRRRVLGGGLALAGLAWLWLWSTPLFSDWVRGTLEGQYAPAALEATPAADAIVVLGGAVQPVVPPRLFPDLGSASDRVWHGARLFHAGKAPLLVLSGGALPWRAEDGPESRAMLAFVTDLGVPQEHVLIESQSATTRENASETARMLTEHGVSRVLLVTSALHMRRAEAAFHAVGLDVVPAATDHEAVEQARTALDYLPDAQALAGSSRAFKEILGLFVYRLRGWAG